MSEEWAAIASGAAAVFSGVTLIFNSRLSSGLERRRWLREARVEAFLMLKHEVSVVRDRFSSGRAPDASDYTFSEVNTALSRFEVLSQGAEPELISRLRTGLRAFVTESERDSRRAARVIVDDLVTELLKSVKETL